MYQRLSLATTDSDDTQVATTVRAEGKNGFLCVHVEGNEESMSSGRTRQELEYTGCNQACSCKLMTWSLPVNLFPSVSLDRDVDRRRPRVDPQQSCELRCSCSNHGGLDHHHHKRLHSFPSLSNHLKSHCIAVRRIHALNSCTESSHRAKLASCGRQAMQSFGPAHHN